MHWQGNGLQRLPEKPLSPLPQLLLRDGEIKIYKMSLVQVRGPNQNQNADLLKDSQSISVVQDAVIKY